MKMVQVCRMQDNSEVRVSQSCCPKLSRVLYHKAQYGNQSAL